MYEEMKNAFVVELAKTDVPKDFQLSVIRCLEFVALDYNITKKDNSLVPYVEPNAQAVEAYLACKRLEGLAEGTLEAKRIILRNYFSVIRKPFDQVSTMEIRAYLAMYQKTRKVTNRSLDALRSALRAFYQWCVDEKAMDRSPAAAIAPIKYEKKERKALSPMELEKLRSCCESPFEKALVEVLFSTGCRISEITNLKLTDINWDTATIDVLGKGNKHRLCYLNARAYMRLAEYLKTRNDSCEYAFAIEHAHWKHTAEPWRKMSRSTAARVIPSIAKRNKKLPKVTAHILRHTTATTALRNGMPIDEVSMLLGHARLETTMIYAKTDRNALQADHKKYIA